MFLNLNIRWLYFSRGILHFFNFVFLKFLLSFFGNFRIFLRNFRKFLAFFRETDWIEISKKMLAKIFAFFANKCEKCKIFSWKSFIDTIKKYFVVKFRCLWHLLIPKRAQFFSIISQFYMATCTVALCHSSVLQFDESQFLTVYLKLWF